jgi:hypothetical protein
MGTLRKYFDWSNPVPYASFEPTEAASIQII